MLLNKRCTVCGETIDQTDSTPCGNCGRSIHSSCKEFEQLFDCPICADELEIGANEL